MPLDNPKLARPALAAQAQARTTAPGAEEHAHGHYHEREHEHGFEWPEAARIAFVALAAAAVWFRLWEPFPALSVIGVLGVLVGGWPIFKEAAENVVARRM